MGLGREALGGEDAKLRLAEAVAGKAESGPKCGAGSWRAPSGYLRR